MKIDHIEVYGFRAAIRGMRNPRDSNDKSDSRTDGAMGSAYKIFNYFTPEAPAIGPSDLRLMRTLIKRGSSHRKFMRMITVWCDITLPRYVWADFDTYKIGTVKNSQSSAFTLGSRLLTPDDFEDQDVDPDYLEKLNSKILTYQKSKTAQNMLRIKRALPEAFLQTSTYEFNYETALSIYSDRKNHLLPEFGGPGGICEMIQGLPFMSVLMGSDTAT